MSENNCGNCRLRDEFGFCEKLVVDTRRCLIYEGVKSQSIKAYYIAEREEGEEEDVRSSFMVPSDFKCIYYKKQRSHRLRDKAIVS